MTAEAPGRFLGRRGTSGAVAAVWVCAAALAVCLPAHAEIRFRRAAEDWNLLFHHRHGGSGERYMPESVVGGVVIFDYDGDGDPDVFFVDGAALPGYEGPEPRSRLFRNDGAAGFVDVTEAAGIPAGFYGGGGIAGDVDGDGDLDLYVAAFGPNRLFRNDGDGTFTDVTEAAGVADPRWSSSSAFADLDRDGDLDLYVVNYVDFTLETHKFCGDREAGIRGYCHPDAYDGLADRLYRNRGDGTFEEATAAVGLDAEARAGLGVAVGDLDDDGWPDLYVTNDAEPNFLFLNRGDGTFEDASLLSGTAHSDRGRSEGSMGVDLGDVDGDGRLDIVVTNFEFESNALYRNIGDGLFVDARFAMNVAEDSLPMLAFGVVLADLDHDRDLDLAIGNGHILDNARAFKPESRHAQPNQVMENRGSRFEPLAGTGFEEPVRVTRGLAAGDLDLDGDLDLVAVNADAVADVYENLASGGAGGRWLQLDLRTAGGGEDRFGVGARVRLRAAGVDASAPGATQIREVRTGASYAAQGALTLHFGLGGAGGAESLRVRWPGPGPELEVRNVPADRRLLIREPPASE